MSTLEQTLQSQTTSDPAPNKDFDCEQWKQQKHQELEETFQQLNAATMQVIQNPDRFQAYLDLQASLPALSVGNALLILDQRSEPVTSLATFDDWRDQGRAVKRGEAGCKILSPVNYKRSDGSESTSFRVSRVFDISQTHGEPSPSDPVSAVPADQMVRALFSQSPVKIVADDIVEAEIGAIYDPESKTIRVHGKLIDAVAIDVLSREMAIATLSLQHDEIGRDRITFAGICASYLIQKRYGYESIGFDSNKIGNFDWPSDPIAVRAVLNDARQAANMVSSRIERGLANLEHTDTAKQTRKPSEQSR
ncbi:MAG: hypothetical protein VB070_15000 [Clostridiaceae bacterium]|nr:hypothetical protein [Clostridiaceae bacterium]